MNLSGKEALNGGKKLSPTKTSLNPNAAEFVPFSLKSVSGNRNIVETSIGSATSTSVTIGKSVLDRTESTASDEEALQYWCHQLPDDITPDFKAIENDNDSHGVKNLSFSSLSLTDVNESPRFPALSGNGFTRTDQTALSPYHTDGKNFNERLRYPVSSRGDDVFSSGFHNQYLSNLRDEAPYAEKSIRDFTAEMMNDQKYSGSADINPLEYLASEFPGFAAESLADVYFANAGDLNLTIEMLTQLELQVDGGLSQNTSTKAFSAPNLTSMDFPALSSTDGQYPKFSGGAIDFASAVRKTTPQNSAMWKYGQNGSANANVGSSKNPRVLASSYSSDHVNGLYGSRLQTRGSSRATPVWLQTGEAVANVYSEMREEARDHARLRNAYFEQARQAYLVGNKALAKELSAKGQLYNEHMKAAHGKAQDSIYRHRNAEIQGNGRSQEKMIDLHGLHVSEALQVLRRELSVLRDAARSADQRLQVYICVGTGHHTKGSRTPARLPVAIQRYLLEEEGLEYSEPQPGLLRVVVY